MKLLIVLTTLILLIADSSNAAKGGQKAAIVDVRKGMVFELYTRENRETPEIIDVLLMARNNVIPKYFKPKRPVRICVHGWNSDNQTMKPVLTALLQQGDYNVILVNWTTISNMPYEKVRSMITLMGTWLAYFLDVLVYKYDLDMSDFHIIGFSMGAHISGEAGRYTTKGKVGRITGLDPAWPLFKGAYDALAHDAAEFVDIIHTCGNLFSFWKPLGHADFYPNGGTCIQPGCMFKPHPYCSHTRAIDFFAESINSIGFISRPFEGGPKGRFVTNKDEAFMGYLTSKSTRGVYYLKTSSQSPFAVLSLPTDNFLLDSMENFSVDEKPN